MARGGGKKGLPQDGQSLTVDAINSMLVAELKDHLKQRGCNTTGRKAELVERLIEALNDENDQGKEDDDDPPKTDTPQTEQQEQEQEQQQEQQPENEEPSTTTTTTTTTTTKEEEEEPQRRVEAVIAPVPQEAKPDTNGTSSPEKVVDTTKPMEEEETHVTRVVTLVPSATPVVSDETVEPQSKGTKRKGLEQSTTKPTQPSNSASSSDSAPTSKRSRTASEQAEVIEVPEPKNEPTNTLLITNFVRPFTLPAVKQYLSQYGTIVHFWIDSIKTHCYVTYERVDEAITTRKEIYGRIWPPQNTSRPLFAEFAAPELNPALATESSAPATTTTTITLSSGRTVTRDPSRIVTRTFEPAKPAPSAKPQLTLEQLFQKTKCKPAIYYLPLTDEQVALNKTKTSS